MNETLSVMRYLTVALAVGAWMTMGFVWISGLRQPDATHSVLIAQPFPLPKYVSVQAREVYDYAEIVFIVAFFGMLVLGAVDFWQWLKNRRAQ